MYVKDDYHNSYNSDADTTHGSINFHNESMTQVNRLEDGTIEITDTLPKKDYYMSLRKNDNRLGGSLNRIGGSNAGFGTMSGTLRSGYAGGKSQSILDIKPSGKNMECLVTMLDGTEEIITLDVKFAFQLKSAENCFLSFTESFLWSTSFRCRL